MFIVVVPYIPHPTEVSAPPIVQQSNCDYQIKISDSPITYHCYSKKEYQSIQEENNRKAEKQAAEFTLWLKQKAWWQVPLGAIVLLILLIMTIN